MREAWILKSQGGYTGTKRHALLGSRLNPSGTGGGSQPFFWYKIEPSGSFRERPNLCAPTSDPPGQLLHPLLLCGRDID